MLSGGMAKPRRDPQARQSGESFFAHQSRLARTVQEARDRDQPLVTPEAQRNGHYESVTVMHVETATRVETKINRGGTPLARWIRADRFNDSQMNAILACLEAWRRMGGPTLIANYGERVATPFGTSERIGQSAYDASNFISRLKAYFPGNLATQWDIFENVCRFDLSSGIAGAGPGFDDERAQTRALVIVQSVADRIAHEEGL